MASARSWATLDGLRIALVILHGDPGRGGAERYTVDLAAGLRGRGQEVSLVASSFAQGGATADDVLLGAGAATRAGRYTRFLDELDRHLESTAYDAVHAMLPVRRCDLYHPHAGVAAEAVATAHLKYDGTVRQALARTANRLNRRRQKFAAVEKKLLGAQRPPVVLCLSEYVKRVVRKHYSISPQRLVSLFNGVDLDKFDPAARPQAGRQTRQELGIAPDRILGLLIAQDFERKGLSQAIHAMGKIDDPRLVLLVAGKQDAGPYVQLARQVGVADRIIFAGASDHPYALYRAADFFVLPTRHDPCSLVVLEALAMGLPVISTAMNGACEVMTPGEHGFVLKDPADVDALAQAMGRMLDPENRRAMSNACLHLRPALSFQRHLDQLLELYRKAAEGRGAAAIERRGPPSRDGLGTREAC